MRSFIGIALIFLAACEDPPPAGPAPKRFDSVKSTPAAEKAAEAFCEKTFAAGAKKWAHPPERPVPWPAAAKKNEVSKNKPAVGWTWVNYWASWCGPCIAELPLLGRWRSTLASEGIPVNLELWSVDEEEEAFKGSLDRNFPGEVKWIASADDLPALLEQLGVDKSSAIPIHALVDPTGNLRCVRVGSVGENAYGQVKTILTGG